MWHVATYVYTYFKIKILIIASRRKNTQGIQKILEI